ncbi:hypothetical protein THRCLA_06447 [Thraustotheca clavata]|uniref:Uncharacterized protein n=1 Tax=Thraustotheca clavata TaxID=74557 RepID=A0A1V9ZNP8_9STRA|nr:hypothetical protein THRCLA_06447 [Thraustotheca clavata]
MIELLNISLSKVAHSRIVLLNKKVTTIDKATAEIKLHGLGHESPLTLKRKRNVDSPDVDSSDEGYFAYFFPITDIDMVWRSVLHAHLFNQRFGEVIEFHTAASGVLSKRDFDELHHIHTHTPRSNALTFSSLPGQAQLTCCLILPCQATEDEIFRVGKNVFGLLNLTGSLYYRSSSDRSDGNGGKLTADVFRQFTTHRIVRQEEVQEKEDGPNNIMGYQPPKKILFSLERLDSNKKTKVDGQGE